MHIKEIRSFCEKNPNRVWFFTNNTISYGFMVCSGSFSHQTDLYGMMFYVEVIMGDNESPFYKKSVISIEIALPVDGYDPEETKGGQQHDSKDS